MSGRKFGLIFCLWSAAALANAWPAARYSASDTASGASPAAAQDGDRFSTGSGRIWKAATANAGSWWQVDFDQPATVGAILQVVGEHDFVLTNAPANYVWQTTEDGERWSDLTETRVAGERRLYRIHRLARAVQTRGLRLRMEAIQEAVPVVREVEFFSETHAAIEFPDWVVAVNMTHDPRLPGHGQEFIPLVRSVRSPGVAQQIWLTDFTPEWVAVEPRPLAAFLSGSFKDWCQVDRGHWRGTEQLLRAGQLPMWASCGGAQGLAIVAAHGVDQPWDCPHCRDPQAPKIPIYTHIGHPPGGEAPACGDYAPCVFERGPHFVRSVADDPVFAGLPDEFQVMESHCGQLEWPPAGWDLIATAGAGTRTKMQGLRVRGRPIYAAQFHIEMDGTPAVSRLIMANFLAVASDWRRRH